MTFTRASRAALAALALVVLLAGTSIAVAGWMPGAGSQPQYTVASKEMDTIGTGTVVVAPTSRLKGISEKLMLVAVGGLLLGLAAAVRRTA
ncbi:MAG: hypothetical protein KBA95_03700 [Acidobacteria bacterium]|nr:hypothetical protein [Acidobacteriota bacterium]